MIKQSFNSIQLAYKHCPLLSDKHAVLPSKNRARPGAGISGIDNSGIASWDRGRRPIPLTKSLLDWNAFLEGTLFRLGLRNKSVGPVL